MNHVRLGRTGLQVSEFCIGADDFGGLTDEDEALRIMGAAFDGGVNFIDTANVYTYGRSEEIIGRFMKGRRYDVVLATKGSGGLGDGPNLRGVNRKYVMQAIDDSLKRLGTDYVDLYQIHNFHSDSPIDEFVQAYSDIVEAGKARYIGVANFAGYQLVESLWQADRLGARRFDCAQNRYSLLVRDQERELLPACSEFGVGVMAYSPRAGGLLLGTRQILDAEPGTRYAAPFRHWESYRDFYWSERNLDVVKSISGVADKYGVSTNALILRWVIRNPAVTSCIVGSATLDQLKENLAAWEEEVPDEALAEATEASDPVRATYAEVQRAANPQPTATKST